MEQYDVIIIGGSYAGLSAGMALGRALRKVLIIDSGDPCNKQTPHSHNFITQDGNTPAGIAAIAREQVAAYLTVSFLQGTVTTVTGKDYAFEVTTAAGQAFGASKLLFATGMRDIMPDIDGIAESWGISAVHCPYCHGYEIRYVPTGILANGDIAFEFSKLITNWTQDLTLFTNGPATLQPEQVAKLAAHNIAVVEKEVAAVEHQHGEISQIVFRDGSKQAVDALYVKLPMVQKCEAIATLGCAFTDTGYVVVDDFQKTSVKGVYAAGDNTTMFRSVSQAVSMGTKAGAMLNKELVDERF